MLKDATRRGLSVWIMAGVVLVAWLLSASAAAQTADAYLPTSTFDAYHNARPEYLARRPVDVFQNEYQREALGSYQVTGRHLDRRGGFSAFALLGDRVSDVRLRMGISTPDLLPGGLLSASQRRALARYGGFGRRAGRDEPGDISAALTRRRTLISATSLNAPVHRALLMGGAGVAVRSAIERTPFMPREKTEPATPAASLDQWLRTHVDLAHARIRDKAWEWLHQGQFRRAARAFETAAILEPSDSESRIGEIFSHLSLRAHRTAMAVFGELNRRDENVFRHQLTETRTQNLADVYGDADEVRRLRTVAQVGTGPGQADPDSRAMQTLVLWYLGKQDEAIRAAMMLARDFPGAAYADWPTKVQVAKTTLPSEP